MDTVEEGISNHKSISTKTSTVKKWRVQRLKKTEQNIQGL